MTTNSISPSPGGGCRPLTGRKISHRKEINEPTFYPFHNSCLPWCRRQRWELRGAVSTCCPTGRRLNHRDSIIQATGTTRPGGQWTVPPTYTVLHVLHVLHCATCTTCATCATLCYMCYSVLGALAPLVI